MITNIYLPGCRRIGIQGGRLRRPRRRAVVGSIWAGGIGIGACQELDPIADPPCSVFPCSRRSDSVPWRGRHAGRRCTHPELRRRWRSMGRRVTSVVSTWPAMGCMRYPGRAAADRQPIATHHAIHHRRHHHRESEARVTRGRGRV